MKLKLVLLLLITIPMLLFLIHLFIKKPDNSKKVAGAADTRLVLSPMASKSPAQNLLAAAVKKALVGTKGSYGIAILHLGNNESYFSNEHQIYQTGSLYKLWIMAEAFEQIRDGKLREDDTLSEDINILYNKFNLASPSAQTSEPTKTETASADNSDEPKENKITFSVRDALEKMIIISDNNAALLLTEKIRLTNVATFLQQHGFHESKVGINGGYPSTTPYDMALFLKKLYKGELNNKEYTEKMLTLLKRQRLNNKLPKYLPEEIIVAHKTGELDQFTHDVGIVYGTKGNYIITVLSESNSRLQAEERIANVSEAVFKYFSE
jgi:beta-lactamase class A